MDQGEEEVLHGGNVADQVVRIGSTVRKPVTKATPAVEVLLEHLAAVGFPAAPRSLGRDKQGVTFWSTCRVSWPTPGLRSPTASWTRLGALIHELHEATSSFVSPPDAAWQVVIPPDRPDFICHNDLAPWNLVHNGQRWVFIDWDGAGPGSAVWDLAYAAHTFVPLWADGELALCAQRLRVLGDGYGVNEQQRRELPALIARHVRGMYDLLRDGARTGRQPWARLYAEGMASPGATAGSSHQPEDGKAGPQQAERDEEGVGGGEVPGGVGTAPPQQLLARQQVWG